ncbi:MAG: methyltransferase [Candidatus Bathyarchaeia archaeon]
MKDKIGYFSRRIIECILALIDVVPSLIVTFNPLLFVMFIPVGVYAILTWPWTLLKDIPDPFHSGESLYWLTYAIILDRDNILFPTLFRWGLIDLFLLASGLAIFLISFISWMINLRKDGGLITSGAYRFSRHPQYLGIILLSLGITIRSLRPISLIAWITLLIGYLILASLEERNLFKVYGQKYEEYARQTAFLIPHLRFNFPKWLSAEKPYRYILLMLVWVILVISVVISTRNIVVALRSLAYLKMILLYNDAANLMET